MRILNQMSSIFSWKESGGGGLEGNGRIAMIHVSACMQSRDLTFTHTHKHMCMHAPAHMHTRTRTVLSN